MGFGAEQAGAEVLVSVPYAELHKVQNNVQQLLQPGTFSVYITTSAKGEQTVEAAVADFSWPLGKHLPALKAADSIYSFALEHTRAEYLIVVLPKGTQRATSWHSVCACTAQTWSNKTTLPPSHTPPQPAHNSDMHNVTRYPA